MASQQMASQQMSSQQMSSQQMSSQKIALLDSEKNQPKQGRSRRFKQLIPKRKRARFALVISIFVLCCLVYRNFYLLRDFIYLSRPMWDKKTDFIEIAHYYHPGLNDDHLCKLHNWTLRPKNNDFHVIDAIIFSVELDLLEIRLKELWPVVDTFVVLEADRTFHGRKKETLLRKNIERFAWAKSKLVNFVYTELEELELSESPFKNEARMRKHMNALLRDHALPGDLIIVTDVDEIPRLSTIQLFRKCSGFPSAIHLALKTYFYSFEFFFSYDDSWRAKVMVYQEGFKYEHDKRSKYILTDAGWHCTFCFRYLSDFRFKMISYSHNDRLMGRSYLLDNKEIQRRACLGLDVFDMYPEAYSYKELFSKLGAIPKTSSYIDLPLEVLVNNHKYAYLLNGNCLRSDFNDTVDW